MKKHRSDDEEEQYSEKIDKQVENIREELESHLYETMRRKQPGVLDQDGAVVWSASDFPYPGNIATFWLEAGLPYYLMVTGEDTMGSDLAYRLKVVEASSQIS